MPEPRPDVIPGAQGRVKRPNEDKRIAANRGFKPNGQGAVKDRTKDKRLAANREGPSGQGCVKDRKNDGRLKRNRRRVAKLKSEVQA